MIFKIGRSRITRTQIVITLIVGMSSGYYIWKPLIEESIDKQKRLAAEQSK